MSERSMPLKYHQIWVVIGWGMVCLIIYLSLSTSTAVIIGGLLNDKLIHALGYCALMLWFAQIYRVSNTRFVFAALFVLMGVVLEFLQGMGGVRQFEFADMMANFSGVVAGWLLASLGLDHILSWFERKVLGRS